MTGHTPWREITKKFSPERKARVAALVRKYKKQMAAARRRKRKRTR